MHRGRLIKRIIAWGIVIIAVAPLLLAFSWGLPGLDVPEPSVIYDVNGRSIKGLSDENRINIYINEIAPTFQQAIVAVEDKNFYRHHGIDLVGIMRAVVADVKAGSIVEGGSTITQQTAKKLFLNDQRTFSRKIQELYYSFLLEREYSKDEILALYCNTVYFGHGAYGVEVAARTFFSKSASDLTLAESALLAGLPRWPNHYDPYQNPQVAKERQGVVLQRMLEEGMISPAQKQEAIEAPLTYRQSSSRTGDAPYFVAMVQEYLSKKYGERQVYQGGLKVYTSLDLDMQRAADQAYSAGMKSKDEDLQAALVAIDTDTGQIRAMVGGRDYNSSNYNRVYSRRQPGSTFKPFMYSLAMDSGLTPATMLMCEETEYAIPGSPSYRPSDYGDNPYHWRPFTLKEALMISDNTIAVQLNYRLGPQQVALRAEQFGFEHIEPVLSLPLGATEVSPMELCAAYCAFANQGYYCQPYSILKVVDKTGRVLEDNTPKKVKAIEPDNAYIITDMLKGVMQPGGTGAALAVPGLVTAGKTGTTDQRKDAWFVGFTARTCCAVWVGYDRDRNVNLTGSAAAGPIWKGFMQGAIGKVASGDFVRPSNIVELSIDLDTGLVATESCPRTAVMAFKGGSQPQEICYLHFNQLDPFWPLTNSISRWISPYLRKE
ncbi:MAG: PBP1A family penicillin-binding protein [Syntrophomonas sp.]